jgi:3-oxoacyl-[acyl-carrier-protein] synthase II
LKISAGKSAFGHLLGAAGAIGVLTGLQAMAAQMVPPTINTLNIDPLIPATLPIVTGKAVSHSINTIMCNSFGFGGHNAIVICKRYD